MKAALAALLLLGPALARAAEDSAQALLSTPRRRSVSWASGRPSVSLVASNVSGVWQLYALDLKRGRWTQVSEDPAGRSWGALSPDGDSVVFLRDVMGSEIGQLFRWTAKRGKSEPLVPDFPAKSITDARFGPSGRNVYFDAADDAGFGAYQFALGGRRAFTLAFGPREIAGVSPSADERYLAYRARSEAGDWDVRAIDLTSGGDAGVLPGTPGSSETFGAWAGEGARSRLLVASHAEGGGRPGIWDVASASVTWLDPGLPGDIAALDWYPDGRELLLLQDDQTRRALWRWDPSSAPVRLDGVRGWISWARVRPDGTVWAATESGERPPDVVDEQGNPVLPAYGKRKPAQGHAARWVSIPSPGGGLSGWLVTPASTAARGRAAAPTHPGPQGPESPLGRGAAVLWLHEGGETVAGDVWDPMRLTLAEQGVVTLALNYRAPRGAAGPVAAELAELAAARDWLVREAGVSPSSVAIAGRFYGGTLALLALAQQPELWAAGVAAGAIADWSQLYEDAAEPARAWCRLLLGGEPAAAEERYAERSPAAHAFTIRAPVLLVHAANDSRAPLRQMQAFDTRLRDAGKPHRLVVLKGGQSEASAADQGLFLSALLSFLHQSGLPAGGR